MLNLNVLITRESIVAAKRHRRLLAHMYIHISEKLCSSEMLSSAVKGLKFLILSVVFMAAGIRSFLLFRPLPLLFLSVLSLSRWNAHKSPSISEEERKEETRSQPSLMYDSAARVKKIP